MHGTVVVLSLGGGELITGARAPELEELDGCQMTCSCSSTANGQAQIVRSIRSHADFIAVCADLKMTFLVTERRAIENYFSQNALDAEYRGREKACGNYDKHSGLDKGKNWRVASELPKEALNGTDLGAFLQQIADRVLS